MSGGEKRILIFSAEPKDEKRIRVSEEVREIQNAHKNSQYTDTFDVHYCPATQIRDIRKEMLSIRPNIVHFCGHGQGEGGIAFEDDGGNAFYVDSSAFGDFLGNFKDTLECVILNVCYSEVQAVEISKHIRYVICNRTEIQDSFAIKFSSSFYEIFFSTGSYNDAFRLACAELKMQGLQEDMLPIMIAMDGEFAQAQSQTDYLLTMQSVDSGLIIENLGKLEMEATSGNLSANLMLSMIYRDGIGLRQDSNKAHEYLLNALRFHDAKPETWAQDGYAMFDKHHPSLEPAAFMTAAIACRNNVIPGRTCAGVARIFHMFHYDEQARRYAEYGANKLDDEKCRRIYEDILKSELRKQST